MMKMFGYRIIMAHPGSGGPWEWRTLEVVYPGSSGPGSGGPWEWWTLGVVDPGSGGPWEWRTLTPATMRKQFCCDASRSMYEDYYVKQSAVGWRTLVALVCREDMD